MPQDIRSGQAPRSHQGGRTGDSSEEVPEGFRDIQAQVQAHSRKEFHDPQELHGPSYFRQQAADPFHIPARSVGRHGRSAGHRGDLQGGHGGRHGHQERQVRPEPPGFRRYAAEHHPLLRHPVALCTFRHPFRILRHRSDGGPFRTAQGASQEGSLSCSRRQR